MTLTLDLTGADLPTLRAIRDAVTAHRDRLRDRGEVLHLMRVPGAERYHRLADDAHGALQVIGAALAAELDRTAAVSVCFITSEAP